MLSICLSTQLW